MLSIRRDQELKTTVSRQGLERDEKYLAVGRLCADMLFEHIDDEVTRIAEKPGCPLSQASSACHWLFSRLSGYASPASGDYLEHLRAKTPTMVIERIVRDEEGEAKSVREMIRGARLDCGGLGGEFPVSVPLIVGPEAHQRRHGRDVGPIQKLSIGPLEIG
jgi:hypothetical protein